MNGVVFFLAVNFIVAICFSAIFGVVSTRSRARTATLWIAAGFAVASLSALCELLVAYTSQPKPWALGAFATVLAGMVLLRVGIGALYGSQVRGWTVAAFLGASFLLAFMIYDLPRGTPLQAFPYQTPFAIVLITSAAAVFRSRRSLAVDRFLGGLLLVTGLQFIAKAGLAVWVGSGSTAKDYVHTNYALISQSTTAVLMVAVGLTLLSVLVLDIMADQRNESERDLLSGLPSRRGFERMIHGLLATMPLGSHCLILCDLDHFKSINDTFGHQAGDRVIQSFGHLLEGSLPADAVAGRIGGEEFAVFLPNTEIDLATLFAQALRNSTMAMNIPGVPASFSVTASFGVAALLPKMGWEDVFRKADLALYEAKHAGRNRVKQAESLALVKENQFKPL